MNLVVPDMGPFDDPALRRHNEVGIDDHRWFNRLFQDPGAGVPIFWMMRFFEEIAKGSKATI